MKVVQKRVSYSPPKEIFSAKESSAESFALIY